MKTILGLMLLAMRLVAADLTLDPSKGKVMGDVVQFDGKPYPLTFKGYAIAKREPDGIKVNHASGITKIPYELLPPELTADAPFDPAAAKTYRDAQKAARAKADAAIAKETELAAKQKPAAKKEAVSATASATFEQEKAAAMAELPRLEEIVAAEINSKTNRKAVVPHKNFRGNMSDVAYVRFEGSWWPSNPILDPQARHSFKAQEAVDRYHALKYAYGL